VHRGPLGHATQRPLGFVLLVPLRFAVSTEETVNVIFEPYGADYELSPDNELRVTVYGEAATYSDGDLLIEVFAGPKKQIVLHLHQANYSVQDKAGNDLAHL
jgi:hypothetical protein